MPFSILYVCTGNICRSPFAELLTRARLDAALGDRADEVRVASAGTRGLVGHPMDPFAAAQLPGLDAGSFRSRELDRRMIRPADLVLTATRAHRRAVLIAEPRALQRTFTLLEFADLLPLTDHPTSPQDLVAQAATVRGSAKLVDYDLADPIGRSPDQHAQVAASITAALETTIAAVVASLTLGS